ncbi:MAG: class II glutamine amidotransferase [Rhizobiales bacterium]|nr:class II glutamine amidotransferase [Hyphomicrobiales bacterium]MBA67452.1 class II glutamine amidotransferase [Hyphomicrobiales bacterium]|tara:strand:- start:1770 stop:2579 length:810 start_codon:yes stop_codon:yes gene_type:complete
MCRWAAYRGVAIPLEQIVSAPGHSLIEQSHCASQAKTATNGDGFGIAWYGDHPEPGLYRDILPAWSDCNLRSLARQIRSPLFLAHVRASTGGATSRDNCHPFVHGRWSFMHNGQVAGFERIRRRLENALSDKLYACRKGTTDSELMFLLALELGLDRDPEGAIAEMIRFVLATSEAEGLSTLIRYTAALSDGNRLHAIRFSTDSHAPTLYSAPMCGGLGHCLVSEPFEDQDAKWHEIPAGSFVTIRDGGMSVRRFEPMTADPVRIAVPA